MPTYSMWIMILSGTTSTGSTTYNVQQLLARNGQTVQNQSVYRFSQHSLSFYTLRAGII